MANDLSAGLTGVTAGWSWGLLAEAEGWWAEPTKAEPTFQVFHNVSFQANFLHHLICQLVLGLQWAQGIGAGGTA